MLVETLTHSKIQIISTRNQVITYEAIPHNPQIPHSLALLSSLYEANYTFFKSS